VPGFAADVTAPRVGVIGAADADEAARAIVPLTLCPADDEGSLVAVGTADSFDAPTPWAGVIDAADADEDKEFVAPDMVPMTLWPAGDEKSVVIVGTADSLEWTDSTIGPVANAAPVPAVDLSALSAELTLPWPDPLTC
jgi:hypothetical protein